MRLDPTQVRQQIDNLILQFPELLEDDILRADMIEAETDLHELMRMLERKRQDASSLAGAIASNIAELSNRQGRFERRELAMRTAMFKLLQWADVRKVELPEATLSVRNGTQKVVITDEAVLPDLLCRLTRAPDKTKIKELLTEGNPVTGAYLSNAEPTLSIRTK